MLGNFDLNTNYDPADPQHSGFKNGWPAVPVIRENTNWRHGDYLQVAYTYIFPFYDKMVSLGELRP